MFITKENMPVWIALAFCAVMALVIVAIASCQPKGDDIPLPVVAKVCEAEGRFTEAEIPNAIPQILAQGCANANWIFVEGKFYVYGTKVLIGEGSK